MLSGIFMIMNRFSCQSGAENTEHLGLSLNMLVVYLNAGGTVLANFLNTITFSLLTGYN